MASAEQSLPQLPQEVLARIAGNLSGPDLLSFRRTCRRISSAATDAFDEQYLHTRTHSFDDRGLRGLLRLIGQPELAKKVRKICFTVGPETEPAGTTRSQRLVSEDTSHLLLKVFQGLFDVGRAPVLALTTDYSGPYDPPRAAANPAAPRREQENENTLRSAGHIATATLLTTLARSQLSPPALEFDVDLGSAAIGVRNLLDSGLRARLQGLQGMKLTSRRPVSGPQYELSQIMHAAPKLESLDLACLSWNPDSREGMLNPVMARLTTTTLRDLALHGFELQGATLIAALQTVSWSLRKLELNGVMLVGPSGWKQLLHWMVENLALDDIDLRWLGGWDGAKILRWSIGDEKNFTAEGETEVKSLLERVAEDGRLC